MAVSQLIERSRERERAREKDRELKTERERGTDKRREIERNSNSNSKTLIFQDSNVRSIWTYLTASLCYTTNTNKHDYTTRRYYKHE